MAYLGTCQTFTAALGFLSLTVASLPLEPALGGTPVGFAPAPEPGPISGPALLQRTNEQSGVAEASFLSNAHTHCPSDRAAK